ncbi:hypothetical protein CEXT_394911 [Caerostris extrusa]|uniref:Uncharacterized protein n=1 Tax=Caerostris extrusa TaxID=172846 RepID=A0AAV4VHI4_CAEEX|nr:hypothetical protein CEXT_394911 [Caerostris extrusa]
MKYTSIPAIHFTWIFLILLIFIHGVRSDGLLEGTLDGIIGPHGIVNGITNAVPNLLNGQEAFIGCRWSTQFQLAGQTNEFSMIENSQCAQAIKTAVVPRISRARCSADAWLRVRSIDPVHWALTLNIFLSDFRVQAHVLSPVIILNIHPTGHRRGRRHWVRARLI